jgi:hypothetical protein
MGKPTLVNGAKYRQAPPFVLERVLASDYEVTEQGCWLWPGQPEHGYGIICYNAGGKELKLAVHRLVYLNLVGDPGDDVPLDHLCHERLTCNVDPYDCPHRRCFNPDHLEPSTIGANARRGNTPMGANAAKTVCDYGHEFTPENTYIHPTGARRCRACHRRERAEFIAARKAGRTCKRCGADISARTGKARYCEQCNPPTWVGSAERTAAKRAAGRACADCGADITSRHGNAVRCERCNPPRWRGRRRRG